MSKKASQCTCAVLVCVSVVARIADTAVRLLAGRHTLSMLTQLDQRRADILGRPHTVTITQTPERLGRLDRTQLTVAVLSPALAILLTTAALPRYAPSEWIRANAVLQLTEAATQPLACNTTHVVQADPSKRHIALRVKILEEDRSKHTGWVETCHMFLDVTNMTANMCMQKITKHLRKQDFASELL